MAHANQNKYLHYDILGSKYPLPLTVPSSRTKEYILMEATILFAKNGYAAVSMRELAEVIGIKPASLYNHFGSKEELWSAVLEHSLELYMLYFRHLSEALSKVNSFEEIVGTILFEPKKWTNIFTCYAFGLIQSEQFRDDRCAEIFNGTFLEYSINFIKKWMDTAIERNWANPFDTTMAATVIMHNTLMGITAKVQETMGRKTPYDPGEMISDTERFILNLAGRISI